MCVGVRVCVQGRERGRRKMERGRNARGMVLGSEKEGVEEMSQKKEKEKKKRKKKNRKE